MPGSPLAALEVVFPEIVAAMNDYFDSHDFILRLAHAHQRLYVSALAATISNSSAPALAPRSTPGRINAKNNKPRLAKFMVLTCPRLKAVPQRAPQEKDVVIVEVRHRMRVVFMT